MPTAEAPTTVLGVYIRARATSPDHPPAHQHPENEQTKGQPAMPTNTGPATTGLFGAHPLGSYQDVHAALTARTPLERRTIRGAARSRVATLETRQRDGGCSRLDLALLHESRIALAALETMEVATSRGETPSALRAQLDTVTTELTELEKIPKARRSSANRDRIHALRTLRRRLQLQLSAEVPDIPGPAGARPPGQRATRVRSTVSGGLPSLGRR